MQLLGSRGPMREQNPMLGLRGCRLGMLYPDINEMQVRAILKASRQLLNEGAGRPPRDHDPAGRPRQRAEAVRDAA